MMIAARFPSAVLAFVFGLAAVGPAYGQKDPAEILDDFIHYTVIAKPDLAAAWAEELLASGLSDAELAQLLDDDRVLVERFNRAIQKAWEVPVLQDLASELDRRVEQGRLDLARNADRITEAIRMLKGNMRGKMLAQQRLVAAGEYAVPKLLQVVTDSQDDRLKVAVGDVIIMIGRQAVTPLCEALPEIDPMSQRYVCDRLADLGYPHAGPYLLELATDEGAATATRDAAARAFRRVGGGGGDLSVLYAELGRQYFNEYESLIAFPGEATNNVWSYDAFTGLVPTAVPTEIISEVMAMRVAGKSLRLDPTNSTALSLFVASNLRRENQLPAGAADPVYGENRYSPAFYATVYGTAICLDVLGMAIDSLDTPLVRDAIAALAQTTGGANLFGLASGRQPLLESLRYPDRRVQYEAALTLGRALPDQPFPGDTSVVPALASAVRTGGASYAVVIAGDEEDRRVAASRLESIGFTIVGTGPALRGLEVEITQAVGVDLVVVDVSSAQTAIQSVADVRILARTAAAPVLLVSSAVDATRLKPQFRDDVRTAVFIARAADDAFAAAVDQLMRRATGGRMTDAEADAYAIEALAALRDIAIAANSTYDVSDAETSLLEAIDGRSGGTRLLVAEILALIDSDRAQRKLFDAALSSTGGEQIELLMHVAESVKRFGDRAEQRHVDALLQVVANSSGATAEAAAQVHGALNLPSETAIQLIPN